MIKVTWICDMCQSEVKVEDCFSYDVLFPEKVSKGRIFQRMNVCVTCADDEDIYHLNLKAKEINGRL